MSQRQHYSHSLKPGWEERIVGLFVVTAIAIIAVVLVINSRNFYLFENTVAIELEATSAQGITRDTPVRVAGMDIGRVTRVELTDAHDFLIHTRIYERYFDMLRVDSRATIGSLSMLGRSSIEFSVGTPTLPQLQYGQRMRVQPSLALDDLIAMAGPLLANVDSVVAQVNSLVHSIEPAGVSRTLHESEQLLSELNRLLNGLQQEGGLVHWLSNDELLVEQIQTNLREVEQLLSASSERLTYVDQTMPRVHDTVDALYDVTINSNEVLLQLPELMLEIRALMEQSQLMVEQASRTWPLSRGARPPSPRVVEEGSYE